MEPEVRASGAPGSLKFQNRFTLRRLLQGLIGQTPLINLVMGSERFQKDRFVAFVLNEFEDNPQVVANTTSL